MLDTIRTVESSLIAVHNTQGVLPFPPLFFFHEKKKKKSEHHTMLTFPAGERETIVGGEPTRALA